MIRFTVLPVSTALRKHGHNVSFYGMNSRELAVQPQECAITLVITLKKSLPDFMEVSIKL